MISSIVTGFVLAAFSSIAYIAYKHHQVFYRVAIAIMSGLLLIYIIFAAYYGGVASVDIASLTSDLNSSPQAPIEESSSSIVSLEEIVKMNKWALITLIFVFVYLNILMWLPWLLSLKNNRQLTNPLKKSSSKRNN